MSTPHEYERERERATETPDDDSPWLSPKQAAAHLGIGVESIYDACAKKGLRHVRLGHSTIRLRRAWLDAWAESHDALTTTTTQEKPCRDERTAGRRT